MAFSKALDLGVISDVLFGGPLDTGVVFLTVYIAMGLTCAFVLINLARKGKFWEFMIVASVGIALIIASFAIMRSL